MQQRETPIFFDRSGKRWIVTENVIVLVVAVVGILVYWLVPLVITNRQPPLLPTATTTTFEHNYENKDRPTASQLMDRLAAKNIAVIGSGPFVRLVELHNAPEGRFAIDPFSQKTVHKLSERESQYINGDNYAIQRYGDTKERQIFLTFDDGPDATYSPALLDLLSRESAPSTFFVAGSGVASFPDIAKRMVDEGHIIGNHTFSHIDFYKVGNFRGEQEINQTQRMIIAATGHETAYFRPPYGGNTDQSLRNGLKSILAAQQLGYTIVSYDFDSNDWHFPEGVEPTYPELDGDSKVILLHDGGGDRTQTFAYVEELIRQAKSKGYNFATIDNIAANDSGNKAVAATLADHASLTAAQAALVWPRQLIRWLFIFSVGSLVVISLLNIVLAIIYRFKTKYKTRSKKILPPCNCYLAGIQRRSCNQKERTITRAVKLS